jgi:hypothetical protein
MTPALAIALITALLGDMPAIVTDVEKLIASLKGQPSTTPNLPVEPGLAASMGAADVALNTPEK